MKTRNAAAMLLFALMAFTVLIGETKAARMKRIIGGIETRPKNFNYAVSITNKDGIRGHKCNGAIISSKHVISSASCVIAIKDAVVRSGTRKIPLNPTDSGTKVAQRHYHSSWSKEDQNRTTAYDVVILELANDLDIDHVNTKIVSLANSAPNMADPFSAVSFGDIIKPIVGFVIERVLRSVNVQLLGDEACKDKGGLPKSPYYLCAIGWLNTDVRFAIGDGGTLLVDKNGKLTGVGSFDGTGRTSPQMYVNLYKLYTWIRDVMAKKKAVVRAK